MTKPQCPIHGDTMKDMKEVGAPHWYTCIASDGPGVCGKSAHEEPEEPDAVL